MYLTQKYNYMKGWQDRQQVEGDNNFFDSVNPKELPFAIPPNSNTQLKLEENMSCLLCPGSKLTNTQGRTKLVNSLGKQQVKVTVGLQGPILSKKIFLHQIQDFYFIWIFQKKNYFKNLKREQVIHKNINS